MSVISVANPKGGSGKTTLVMVLAQELSEHGATVAVIDADPNGVIARWADQRREGGLGVPFTVVSGPKEAEMVSLVTSLSQQHQFVLIDLEGTANRIMSRAFARSNLVMIPFNPSPIDARLAAEAVKLVQEESEALEREISYRLICSRAPAAVVSRSAKRIFESIANNDLPRLSASLVERAAYRDIFERAATISELESATTSGLDQAKANAAEVAAAVVEALREIARETELV
jgi:chromosome partitioning protein